MTQTSPRVSSRTRLAIESAERTKAPLNGNAGYSLLKQEPRRTRGLDIRFERDGGQNWMSEKLHVWSTDGEGLPVEWTALISDPTVVRAVMFPSTQRTWQASKRRNVAEYDRARDIDPKALDFILEVNAAVSAIIAASSRYNETDLSIVALGAVRGMLKGIAGLGEFATHAPCVDPAAVAAISRLVDAIS